MACLFCGTLDVHTPDCRMVQRRRPDYLRTTLETLRQLDRQLVDSDGAARAIVSRAIVELEASLYVNLTGAAA